MKQQICCTDPSCRCCGGSGLVRDVWVVLVIDPRNGLTTKEIVGPFYDSDDACDAVEGSMFRIPFKLKADFSGRPHSP